MQYYKELNIRVALTYVELWNRGNRINVSQRLRETLENFLRYQQQHLAGVDYHAVHLLTYAPQCLTYKPYLFYDACETSFSQLC